MDEIVITNHAIERYIERYAANLSAIEDKGQRDEAAAKALRYAYENSVYVSDLDGAKLFRSKIIKADLIIRDGVLVTLFPVPKSRGIAGKRLRCRKQKRNLTRHYFLAKKRGGYDVD